MKEHKPIVGFWDVDCPIQDGEYSVCQVTQTKCPKATENETTGDWSFDFPDDCPAKEGITIKI